MTMYIALLHEPLSQTRAEQIREDLKSHEDLFSFGEQAWILKTNISDVEYAREVFSLSAESDAPRVGAVFKLNGSYSGYYYEPLWDWLKEARRESG